MKAVRDVSSDMDVVLNSAVTIMVRKMQNVYEEFRRVFNNQIENAGTIVLSRTDVADEKKVNCSHDPGTECRCVYCDYALCQLTSAQLLNY